jgi:hypothetical protein
VGTYVFAIVVIVLVVGFFGLLFLTGGLRMRDGTVIGRRRRSDRGKD